MMGQIRRHKTVARIHHTSWVDCNPLVEPGDYRSRRHKSVARIHRTSWVERSCLAEMEDYRSRRHTSWVAMAYSFLALADSATDHYHHHRIPAVTGTVLLGLVACYNNHLGMAVAFVVEQPGHQNFHTTVA